MTHPQITVGMQVVGTDGGNIGTVKEVRNNDFLVNIPMHRDVYVPYNAVQNVTGNTVALNIPSNQINNMGWPNPSLT
jgi:hypothetical protein